MTMIPPDMEFDGEFDEEAPRPRREKRIESAWEKQAANWRGPEFHAACCGTSYGAMTREALDLTLQVHRNLHQGADHRAPIELGRDV